MEYIDEQMKQYRKAATQGDSYSQAMLGNAYYLAKDYREALPWLTLAGEQDEVLAQMILGEMFYLGKGVEQDNGVAINWYKRAAGQGNREAEAIIGTIHYLEGNYGEAIKWLMLAAEHGVDSAKNTLAILKNGGIDSVDVRKNSKTVQEQYTEAESLLKTSDYTRGVNILRELAGNGYAPAQCELGILYCYGTKVRRNDADAFMWVKKAADQNYVKAQNFLGAMYHDGIGVKTNYLEAYRCFRKAADQGDVQAQNNLGDMYYKGEGISINNKEAYRWYKLAAEQGNSDAQYSLGFLYCDGEGVEKNYGEAIKWFKLAAAKKNVDAEFMLGCVYSAIHNYKESIKWYMLAAEHGDKKAQEMLEKIAKIR